MAHASGEKSSLDLSEFTVRLIELWTHISLEGVESIGHDFIGGLRDSLAWGMHSQRESHGLLLQIDVCRC